MGRSTGRSMAISTCSWVLVLRGGMSRASARRVSTGFGIAGNYRVPTLSFFIVIRSFFDLFFSNLRLFSINPDTVKGKTVEIRQVFGSYLLLVQA